MPKVKSKTEKRINIRLPKPLIEEVERIVKKFPMYGNRQQFVEAAIREKLEKVMKLEASFQNAAG